MASCYITATSSAIFKSHTLGFSSDHKKWQCCETVMVDLGQMIPDNFFRVALTWKNLSGIIWPKSTITVSQHSVTFCGLKKIPEGEDSKCCWRCWCYIATDHGLTAQFLIILITLIITVYHEDMDTLLVYCLGLINKYGQIYQKPIGTYTFL